MSSSHASYPRHFFVDRDPRQSGTEQLESIYFLIQHTREELEPDDFTRREGNVLFHKARKEFHRRFEATEVVIGDSCRQPSREADSCQSFVQVAAQVFGVFRSRHLKPAQ